MVSFLRCCGKQCFVWNLLGEGGLNLNLHLVENNFGIITSMMCQISLQEHERLSEPLRVDDDEDLSCSIHL